MSVLLGMTATGLAEETTKPAAPKACQAPEHRQFDFWVGEWSVTQAGKAAGTNRIERILDGCALLESWTGASGYRGNSLNFYDPARKRWREWRVPGANPMVYSVYVDERDAVWLTDFGANALWRFEPGTQRFTKVELPTPDAAVRQMLGRRGEVWGAASGTDKLVVVRTR